MSSDERRLLQVMIVILVAFIIWALFLAVLDHASTTQTVIK